MSPGIELEGVSTMWITMVLCLLLLFPAWAQAQVSSFANRNLEQFLTTGTANSLAQNEDTTHVSGSPGIMVLCVRNDAATVLAGTTLDYIPCTTNASGQILVVLPAGAAATQVQGTADDGAAEVGNPVQIGGVDAGGLLQAILVGTDGRFDVNVGQVAGTTTATNAGVLGAGVLRMTIATDDEINDDLDNIRIAVEVLDNIAHTRNEVFGESAAMGCEFDDTAPVAATEGNVSPCRISVNRNLYSTIRDAAGNERGANVNASNELNVSAAVTSFPDNEPFNVAQFGGSAVVTGTGAGGAGIPRVTISNDSSLAANQSVNVSQINAVTPLMGNGTTGTGSQRVTIASDNTAFTVNVGTFPDNEPINVAQINGVAPLMGAGVTGTGSPRVSFATDANNVDVERAPAAATVNAENAGMVADTTMVAAVANTRLMSSTFQENAGTPANAFGILRHGVSAPPCTGNVIQYVKLGPSQSVSMSWGLRGLAVASGVCMDWISGTIDGSTATVVEAAP